MPLLSLGKCKFEIGKLDLQAFDEEVEVKWPAIARFGGRPARQHTGFGEDPIHLSGLLYPEEIGGRAEYDKLKATARARRPVTLVTWSTELDNEATIWGQFVILRVSGGHTKFGPDGKSRKIAFDTEIAPLGDIAAVTQRWF